MNLPRTPSLLHSVLSSVALLGGTALAQCPQGATAGLVKWTAGSGYASTYAISDESITAPPIALPAPFFMPGAGMLDQMWVSSNGEVYFTDSALALAAPVGGATYGIDTTAEMAGPVGSSARVAVLGDDQERSIAPGAQWSVTVDLTVPGEVTVTWADVRRYLSATSERFSFKGHFVLATGVIECSYGTTFPAGYSGCVVGVSIGGVAPAVSSDLTTFPGSGFLPLLFQTFAGPADWDLAGTTVTLAPNGIGGYFAAVAPYLPPPCAFAAPYGKGCYQIDNNLRQVFPDSPTAMAALAGNSMTFINTGTGYVAVWNGALGPGFVPPGLGTLFPAFADLDDGNVAVVPSAPIPTPAGPIGIWNISVNGILTAGAAANNPGDWTPTAAEMIGAAAAPSLAFYGAWRDFTLLDTVPNGSIVTEEVGGLLCVTWNAVEAYPIGVVNPSTWQFQIDMATGNVAIVWVAYDASPSLSDTLVGAKLLGPGTQSGGVVLATDLPVTVDAAVLSALTLEASGRPVITAGGAGPTLPITLTATNVPDALPPFGVAVGILIFSAFPMPGGLDLGFLGMPDCDLNVASLDVMLPVGGASGTLAVFAGAIPQPLFPGLDLHAQLLALFPAGILPGGRNAFGGLMSNGVTLHFELQ